MKILVTLIILISFSSLLSVQTEPELIDMLTISYSGDSTLLTEKYEIDVKKKKVYYITPIMSYLHVKGEKYRTRIRVKKQDWTKIESLATSIYHHRTDENEKTNKEIPVYSIIFSKGNAKLKGSNFSTEEVPTELLKLFEVIRN